MKKQIIKSLSVFSFLILISTSCGPLNPVNDFFGIQMNPAEEQNFKIVSYTDVDGISYRNSINMNPKINAWAEFTPNEIILKVVNNSEQTIQLNYTNDQFIVITDEKEYYLGKGERAEYFKKGMISPHASETFILELPLEHENIANSGGTYVDQAKSTRDVLRNYSKTEGKLNVMKDNVKYLVAKFGNISIVLKRVPETK